MNMKRKNVWFFAAFALAAIVAFSSFNYINEPGKTEKKGKPTVDQDDMDYKTLFWFYVTVKDNKKSREYVVKRAQGTKIMSGLKSDYERSLWQNLVEGRLAIGPFGDFEEAKGANVLYNTGPATGQVIGTIHTDEVHYFYVKVRQNERTKAYKIEPVSSKLETGTLDAFKDAFREGLGFQMLAVGPFWDYNEAEEAKRFYSAERK